MRAKALTALVAAAIVAALLIAPALATSARSACPATVRGSEFLRADVTRTSGTKPVTLRMDGKGVYVLPLAKNVTVICTSGSKRQELGPAKVGDDAAGATDRLPRDEGGRLAQGRASFRLFSIGGSYTLTVPKGVTAKLDQRAERPAPTRSTGR